MSFWKNQNVLVTGADGFIGSWVAKTLVEKGANVVVIERDIKKKSCIDLQGLRGKVTAVQGDIIDYAIIERILNENDISTVFHLAAQAIVGTAGRSPLSTFESNIKGTWTILEACRKSPLIKRLVVASSDKAYGTHKELPYREDQPLLGIYPYDASKVCTDVLSRCYFQTYGLPVAVTRNANTYGGADMNFSRIIPDAIKHILKGKEFEIRSDGKFKRDYMYIKDAVDGYLLLAENMDRDGIRGEAFNFGSGETISVLDLFNKISELCGKKAVPKVLGTATGEIKEQYLAIEKAKRLLGWEPKYSLEAGLKETILWYQKFFEEMDA